MTTTKNHAHKTASESPSKKGRKAKTVETVERSPAEQALCDRYARHTIKPGSYLAPAAEGNPFPGKAVVTIVCPGRDGVTCGTERQLCSSDLHHCNACRECRAAQKKAARKARRLTTAK